MHRVIAKSGRFKSVRLFVISILKCYAWQANTINQTSPSLLLFIHLIGFKFHFHFGKSFSFVFYVVRFLERAYSKDFCDGKDIKGKIR